MKRFGLLAAAIASMSLAPIAMSAPGAAGQDVLANCKKVKKSVVRVCRTYNAHKKVTETYRNQLSRDRLTMKYAKAHILSTEGVFKAIRDRKSRKNVRGKVDKLAFTGFEVLSQLEPLADRYRNYNAILKDFLNTAKRYENAVNSWLDGKTDDSENCSKIRSKARKLCRTHKTFQSSLSDIRAQLKVDRLTLEHVRSTANTLRGVMKAVRTGKSHATVRTKARAYVRANDRLISQLAPLADRYRVYNRLFFSMLDVQSTFEDALDRYLGTADDGDDHDDADDFDDADDADDQDDADDFDDADDSDDDHDDSDDQDDADDFDDADDSDDDSDDADDFDDDNESDDSDDDDDDADDFDDDNENDDRGR